MDLKKVKPSKNVVQRRPTNEAILISALNAIDPTADLGLDDFNRMVTPAERKNLNEGRTSFSDIMFRKATEEYNGHMLKKPQWDTGVRIPGREQATPDMLIQMMKIWAQQHGPRKKIF